MYYIPIILTIVANVLYHIAQKNTSSKINPMFALIIAYATALIISSTLFFIMKDNRVIKDNLKELNWANILLGGAIVFLELGFLLAYRAGWNIGKASIICTVIVSIILIPIGVLFFKEQINIKNIIGILISIIGIMLINSK